jgi:hypothetical protein
MKDPARVAGQWQKQQLPWQQEPARAAAAAAAASAAQLLLLDVYVQKAASRVPPSARPSLSLPCVPSIMLQHTAAGTLHARDLACQALLGPKWKLTDAADSCTVNVTGVVPLLPSTTGERAVTVMFGA